ncbi:SagB/ThcOx family dehydrogenase [Massilia sp. W12]|uniref:SagB/ThcOx family dehydrogenase n=1 Tax=Massilia sp. W12 TaxID=3126507 RepID=UPI0030D02CAD
MLTQILFAAAPLLLYAVWLGWRFVRGNPPPRFAINVQLSLWLMLYLMITAGLGLFWVANQQLPVFDWHYLFGYLMLLLCGVHLYFNLPLVWRYWRRPGAQKQQAAQQAQAGAPAQAARRQWGRVAFLLFTPAAAYWLGRRGHAANAWWEQPAAATGAPALQAEGQSQRALVMRYHEFSSESRRGVFARAPVFDWGQRPPPFKDWPGLTPLRLQRSAARRSLHQVLQGTQPRTQDLRLAELADILFAGPGITLARPGSAPLRAAPSSGALFPAELYVLVRRMADLAPGLYHYDARDDSLRQLAGAAAAAPLSALLPPAPLALICTAVLGRTGYKYRERAYRYAGVDLGHLLENLRLAGHNHDMQVLPLAAYDDAALQHAMRLDLRQELALAVMLLQPAQEMPQAVPGILSAQALTPGALGLNGLLHQATSLHQTAAAAMPAPGPDPAWLRLPPARPLSAPLREVLQNRRSRRRYTDQALSAQSLSDVLAALAAPVQFSPAIRCYLGLQRVAGVASGLYRYQAERGLRLLQAGDFGARLGAAALDQDVIGEAAAVLLICADSKLALAAGARGYRHMLLECGMVGERWLLAAQALGLAACPVGAFYDDEVSQLFGLQARGEWALHFASLGIAGQEEDD